MVISLFTASFKSPIGIVRLTASDRGITEVLFAEEAQISSTPAPAFLQECLVQLNEYFEGKRTSFDSLPLAIRGTDFQQRVWDAASGIPYGSTDTYGNLVRAIGMNGGAQAVGSALSRNPLCIIVPCHRVLPQSDTGDVGGYAGGVWRKEWLLKHEQISSVATTT
jgi:methylated-DNA-[protein]-cysteine S-methyltransferase